MTEPLPPARYRVFAPPGEQGGKLVSVHPAAGEEASSQAATSGAPLTAFVEAVEPGQVTLRLFTHTREKGASDSGAIAALAALQGRVPDALDVQMAGETQAAQLCGGEWLLMQGDVQVQSTVADLSGLGLDPCPVWITSSGRPNLAVQLPDLDTLTVFAPSEHHIAELNRATGTTGLLLFTPGGAPHVGMARADVSFRAFGPLKGFLEDAASSNMFACLTGVLSMAGLLPDNADVIRGAQLMPGTPARLTAQFTPAPDGARGVWVGGGAAPAGL